MPSSRARFPSVNSVSRLASCTRTLTANASLTGAAPLRRCWRTRPRKLGATLARTFADGRVPPAPAAASGGGGACGWRVAEQGHPQRRVRRLFEARALQQATIQRQGASRQGHGGRPRAAGCRLGAACIACARARVVLDRRANGEPRLWSLHNKKLTAQKPFLCVILKLTHTKLATVSYASYYAYRTTSRRSGAGPPRNAHLCMSIILLSSTCMYVVYLCFISYQIH